MKLKNPFIGILLLGLGFCSCEGGAGKVEASDSANLTRDITNRGGENIDSAENNSGAQLIAAEDCFTCHEMEEQNVGPSYMQIAKRYDYNQGNVENLANKIRHGGRGLWGNNVMNPHMNVSEPAAREMARYILSLNTTDTTNMAQP